MSLLAAAVRLPVFVRRYLPVALLCGWIATASAQTDAWRQGNDEYAAGHYKEAVERYESLVRAGETSASLFYNLGNAAYRAGDLGRAILNYERALALEPHHPEALANLRLVRDKARALELRSSWWDRAANFGTSSQYSIAAAACFWLAAFALAAWLLRRRRSSAAPLCFVFALLLFAGAVAALYGRETGQNGRDLAIVVGKSIEARLATADNAGTVLALPPGSEIKILNTRGDWIYAALPNDLRGWLPAQSAERVRL